MPSREPCWSLKELADFKGTTVRILKGKAAHYPLPDHYNNPQYQQGAYKPRTRRNHYPKSLLLKWYEEAFGAQE